MHRHGIGSQTLTKTVGPIRQPALVVGETVNASDAGRRNEDGMTAQKAGQRKIGATHRAPGATGELRMAAPCACAASVGSRIGATVLVRGHSGFSRILGEPDELEGLVDVACFAPDRRQLGLGVLYQGLLPLFAKP